MERYNGLFQTWPVPLLIPHSWAVHVYWLHIWAGSEEDESSLIHTIIPLCCKSCFMGDKQASKSSQQIAGSHGTAHWCNYMIALVKIFFYECGVAIGWKVGPYASLSCISKSFVFRHSRLGGGIVCVLNSFCASVALKTLSRKLFRALSYCRSPYVLRAVRDEPNQVPWDHPPIQ